MKKVNLFIFQIALLLVFLLQTSMTDKPKKVLFFGDSITQAGIKEKGYIHNLSNLIDPLKHEVIGAGIGGNKVYDLFLRLESDVLDKKPDVVFIYVGINDIWHKELSRTGTDYNKFFAFYQAIINKMKLQGIEVVLCTPSLIGEKKNNENALDAELNDYSNGIRALAEKNQLQLCDLRKAFLDYEEKHNVDNIEKGLLTTDGVHLNDLGNNLVAQTMINFIK